MIVSQRIVLQIDSRTFVSLQWIMNSFLDFNILMCLNLLSLRMIVSFKGITSVRDKVLIGSINYFWMQESF